MKKKKPLNTLLIHLSPQSEAPLWWYYQSATGETQSGKLENEQALHQLQPLSEQSRLTLLIPAECVLFHPVTFSGRYSPRHQQALAWQLESFCLSDSEQLHITLLQQQGDHCALAAIEKTLMHRWLTEIKNAGFSPEVMIPDVLALPHYEAEWSAVQLEQCWLVRQTANSGFSANEESLAFILAQTAPTPNLHYFSPAPSGFNNSSHVPVIPPLRLLAQGAALCKTNLLHGEFSQTSTQPPRWLKQMVAPLMLGYLLSYTAEPLVTSYLAQQQAGQLRQQTQQLYQRYFPDQTLEMPPQQQLPNQLKALEKNRPTPGLMSLLATSQPLLQQLGSNKVLALSWQNDSLTFSIDAGEQWLRQQTQVYPIEGTTLQISSDPSGTLLTLSRSST
jgi:general secretion pathway protein L